MNKNIKIFGISALCLTMACICSLSNTSYKTNAAEPTTIEAFAHYEFEDETNFGKDSSKHGFDLTQVSTSATPEAIQMLEEAGEKYLSIRRDEYATGKSKNTGAFLYAPQLGDSSFDFSDMISGSYTVSMTFRSDNTKNFGDVYAVSFGRYGSALTIVPWRNSIEIQLNNLEFAPGETQDEKQVYVEANRSYFNHDTREWTQLTVVANADNKTFYIYINNTKVSEVVMPGVRLSSPNYDNYAFALGAQANIYGQSSTQYGNVDFKDFAIYDCALSAKNVQNINEKKAVTVEDQGSEVVAVKSVGEIDTSTIDLEITDANPINDLVSSSMPEKVKVEFTNGVSRSMPVYWYAGKNQTIKGYVQSGAINASLKELELKYKFVAKFQYDESLVTIKNIQLDGVDYVPGTEITADKKTLTFKIEPKPGVEINSVSYFDMEWEAEDDGVYYIDFTDGAQIVIDAALPTYTITYYDGDDVLGNSSYSKGGNETLKSFDKGGYTFEGWYIDKEFKTKFESLDYANPKNLILYAKYTKQTQDSGNDGSGTSSDTPAKKGCKGEAVGTFASMIALLGVFVASKKRK